MKIIDSHQHFWHYNQQDFGWIDDSMKTLQMDFLPTDYLAAAQMHNIVGSVVIQARQSNSETEWLLKLSDQFDFILGVVGWVDLKSQDLERYLIHYKQHYPKLKGFRHVIHDEPELDFMLDADFIRGVSLLGQYGYTYDILIKSEHLANTILFLEQLPNMKIVIDHIAKPNIKESQWDDWAEKMAYIAHHFPHVYCKVSGVVTEADWNAWQPSQLQRYIQEVIKQFGDKRVMFGSDWPVCQVAAQPSSVIDLCQSALDECAITNQEDFYYQNTTRFYSLT